MIVDYFQIGAHIGNTANDHIFKQETIGKTYVLVEPVPYLFRKLEENYANKSRNNSITLLNLAVSNIDGQIKIYAPSEKNDYSGDLWWADQIASVNPEHIKDHHLNIIVDVMVVPCKKLNTIFAELGVESVGTLLIDTEGHDYDILMGLDLEHIKPENIIFENRHIEGFGRRGQRYAALLKKLCAAGYVVVSESDEDTHVRQLSK